jgi:hypothetical protein
MPDTADANLSEGWTSATVMLRDIIEGRIPATNRDKLAACEILARTQGAYVTRVDATVEHRLVFRQLAPGDPIEELRKRGIPAPGEAKSTAVLIDVAPARVAEVNEVDRAPVERPSTWPEDWEP